MEKETKKAIINTLLQNRDFFEKKKTNQDVMKRTADNIKDCFTYKDEIVPILKTKIDKSLVLRIKDYIHYRGMRWGASPLQLLSAKEDENNAPYSDRVSGPMIKFAKIITDCVAVGREDILEPYINALKDIGIKVDFSGCSRICEEEDCNIIERLVNETNEIQCVICELADEMKENRKVLSDSHNIDKKETKTLEDAVCKRTAKQQKNRLAQTAEIYKALFNRNDSLYTINEVEFGKDLEDISGSESGTVFNTDNHINTKTNNILQIVDVEEPTFDVVEDTKPKVKYYSNNEIEELINVLCDDIKKNGQEAIDRLREAHPEGEYNGLDPYEDVPTKLTGPKVYDDNPYSHIKEPDKLDLSMCVGWFDKYGVFHGRPVHRNMLNVDYNKEQTFEDIKKQFEQVIADTEAKKQQKLAEAKNVINRKNGLF